MEDRSTVCMTQAMSGTMYVMNTVPGLTTYN